MEPVGVSAIYQQCYLGLNLVYHKVLYLLKTGLNILELNLINVLCEIKGFIFSGYCFIAFLSKFWTLSLRFAKLLSNVNNSNL